MVYTFSFCLVCGVVNLVMHVNKKFPSDYKGRVMLNEHLKFFLQLLVKKFTIFYRALENFF